MLALEALLDKPIPIEPISDQLLDEHGVQLDVLRADLIHSQVSGNKLFKLLPYFRLFYQNKQSSILSFGGAYSNHLRALAFACKELKIPCIAVIRGGEQSTNTLNTLEEWGVQLIKISRKEYQQRNHQDWLHSWQQRFPDAMIIPEGGMGQMGVQGCIEWGKQLQGLAYDQIAIAAGTGTTTLGLALGSQKPILSVLASKDFEVPVRVEQIRQQSYPLIPASIEWQYDYHFGGFAKRKPQLMDFIDEFNHNQNCKIEPVYTGKLLFAIIDLIKKSILTQKRILAIHSGGMP